MKIKSLYKFTWVNNFMQSLKPSSVIYDLGQCQCQYLIENTGSNMKKDDSIYALNCQNYLNICREQNLEIVVLNRRSTCAPKASSDAILCIDVLHNLYSYRDRLDLLFELKRLIKPDCRILLSVWSIDQPPNARRHFNNYGNNIVLWENYGHVYEKYYYIFRIEEIQKLFQITGFEVIEHEQCDGHEIFTLRIN